MKNNSYLKDFIRENKKETYEQFGENLTRQQIYLESWMKPKAVWQFIKFYYKGCIELKSSSSPTYIHECQDLFRVACFFESEPLQELLLAQEIIPNMVSNTALLFIKEYPCLNSNFNEENQKMPVERAKRFLNDYCLHFISKNLPKIIRSQQSQLAALDIAIQYQLCTFAVDYLIDKQDLDVIVNHMAQVWTNRNPFDVLENIHE